MGGYVCKSVGRCVGGYACGGVGGEYVEVWMGMYAEVCVGGYACGGVWVVSMWRYGWVCMQKCG